MEKVLNEIYREYIALLEKMKMYSFDETVYFMEIAGQVFEKEAFNGRFHAASLMPQSDNMKKNTIKNHRGNGGFLFNETKN